MTSLDRRRTRICRTSKQKLAKTEGSILKFIITAKTAGLNQAVLLDYISALCTTSVNFNHLMQTLSALPSTRSLATQPQHTNALRRQTAAYSLAICISERSRASHAADSDVRYCCTNSYKPYITRFPLTFPITLLLQDYCTPTIDS